MRKDISLYIHIPFCKTICLYCNFLTFAHKNKWTAEYVDAVCREISERGVELNQRHPEGISLETVYFGGGTPSLIPPELIKKIIQQVHGSFSVKKNAEISLECNPESVDAHRLSVYQEAGVTRFSLGVQSLNGKTLKRIARPHDSRMIFQALRFFQDAGVKNFGTDFIMGLPGQTLASFQDEVHEILKFHPAHLSFYFLSYDTKKIDLFLADCPQEEEQIVMYDWLCGFLKESGFIHYEVSNWAQPGYECEHNKRYWEQKDYLGVGIGAHSIVDGTMWENGKDFDAYLKDPMKTEGAMAIDSDLKRMEYLMLGLRTNQGVNLERYGVLAKSVGDAAKSFDSCEKLLKNAQQYLRSGDLEIVAKKTLRATEKGFLILERIVQSLI
jgi:oxygen-independent coproporphyrinogen-3 oxidase